MGREKSMWVILNLWVLLVLSFTAHCDGSEVSLKLLRTPRVFSNRNYAKFAFQVLVNGNGDVCVDCSTYCKLDDNTPSVCKGGEVTYTQLLDGNHTFEICTNGSHGVGCANYRWTVDTVPPTAYIEAPTSFTDASNVSVSISFSEPCDSQGGFGCSTLNSCNLLVYGAGQVVPNTLKVIEPNLKFSLVVSLSTRDQYGRVVLVMDKNFCSDSAGNKFKRTENSSFFVHFDRRTVFVDIRTHIPERLLQIDSDTRTVLATNETENMKVYLYFTEPVVNSSTEILNSLNISRGLLTPISVDSFGERRFGYQVTGISQTAIVTLSLNTDLILSRQGTPVAPVTPVTFLYDMQRPAVRLSTTSRMRTREEQIPILIKFVKPVFGFNSSHISISGGHLQSFQEMSRSIYSVSIQARDDFVYVSIPENVTRDVAGNRNLQSNVLQLRHYSVPVISQVISIFATAAFGVTTFVAGLLTVSTSSLQSVGAYSRPSSLLTSDPARNLFRIASHIQIFALSRWLPTTLPVEYYELARGLQWSVPYFSLPWETESTDLFVMGPSSPNPHSYKILDSGIKADKYNVAKAAGLYGLPLTPMEYRSIFESLNIVPEAQYIVDPQYTNGWRDFDRSMFWLAMIVGCLMLLHALLLFVLRLRKDTGKKWSYGALVFPRFEIFLSILAIPCICKASVTIVKGGSTAGTVVGILLLGLVSFLLLALFLFLSVGITCGKLLQYKEVHQEGLEFHWYQELVRVTLGPGKRGQWTWKTISDSTYLTILGPLFEDLRGPPKYMLSQITGGEINKHRNRIIASDDETEDAEAPLIQKVFGILRIYYTFLETAKRVCLGIVAGAYLKNWSSKTPVVVLLCITSFQLFFIVLKKPFIKKKVQLVEIIAVTCEVGIFAACVALLEREYLASAVNEARIGIFMLVLFIVSFLAQLINEWHALYSQTKQLDPDDNSFCSGLEAASIGFLLLFSRRILKKKLGSKPTLFDRAVNGGGDCTSSADRNRSSGSRSSGDKTWMRQIREVAKASFSKEGNSTSPSDPSSSRVKWSGFWNTKTSGTSSVKSSADFKSKSRGLYKDLENIFASKS